MYELPSYGRYKNFSVTNSDASDSINFYSNSKTQITHISTSDNLENSNSARFLRFNNPLLNYSHKYGNYLGKWGRMYPHLAASFSEVAQGARKPIWFFSKTYEEKFKLI